MNLDTQRVHALIYLSVTSIHRNIIRNLARGKYSRVCRCQFSRREVLKSVYTGAIALLSKPGTLSLCVRYIKIIMLDGALCYRVFNPGNLIILA